MKRVIAATVLLWSLAVVTPLWAEQVRVKVFDMAECGGPVQFHDEQESRLEECQKFCKEQSGPLNDYLSKGWTVVSQRDIVIARSPFKTNRVGVSDNGWCRCKGAEYVLSTPDH
jgi:hypothetical protein